MNAGRSELLATVISARDSDVGRRWLVAILDGRATSYPLPEAGTVTIGRSPDCDIQLDDPSVSREHARLYLDGGLSVEDLGSSNGTSVRSVAIPARSRAPLELGDLIEIGSATAILQGHRKTVARRVLMHGHFEGRVEEECARARRERDAFALLRIDGRGSSSADQLRDCVVAPLRDSDVLGWYGPSDFEVLLPGQDAAAAERILQQIERELARRGMEGRTAQVAFPGDGSSAQQLFEVLAYRLKGAEQLSQDLQYIVADPAMEQLYAMLRKVAVGNISVLLMGESGVGKEVVAEAVHRHSPRAERPLVRINCAALSESLLESELFGHEKGAFTGATGPKEGLLEAAQGGTVFLDEAGEMPMAVQVKLLRVLEERKVRRVGGIEPRDIDVRFVAATNRDIEEEVEAGNFREDLYYRLAGVPLVIPPLRERKAEVVQLAELFAHRSATELGLAQAPQFSEQALQALRDYSWPGNIRELRNVIERAVLLAEDTIDLEHLPIEKMQLTLPRVARGSRPPPVREQQPLTAEDEELRAQVIEALTRSQGNITGAARELGKARQQLQRWVRRFDLDPASFRDSGTAPT